MTREEAADLLDNLIGMVEDNQENDYDEALKMAIEALNVTDTNVGDTISRQAAIDAKMPAVIDGQAIDAVPVSVIKRLPSEQPERQWIIEALKEHLGESYEPITQNEKEFKGWLERMRWHVLECDRLARELELAKASAQPETEKYEYHYDHTDCIWYRPEARNRCPVTCAQYRDGWNDAMNYIFRDGKGYMPYRRDKQYGE